MNILWYLNQGINIPAREDQMVNNDFSELINVVSGYFKIDVYKILSKSRRREIVLARQFAQYFAMKMDLGTLDLVGKQIGNRDHSTVSHSVRLINDLLSYDIEIKQHEQNLIKLLCS